MCEMGCLVVLVFFSYWVRLGLLNNIAKFLEKELLKALKILFRFLQGYSKDRQDLSTILEAELMNFIGYLEDEAD